MGRRTLLLVAALVVAALGTLLIFGYVRNADNRALKDQQPVEVLVAKTLIKAGALGSEAERLGSFDLKKIPRSATIAGVLSDPRPIADLVAVSDIYPGEQIISAKFARSGTTSILPIPTGKIAISVQLGDPQRVAGFVQPGSEVVIFVMTTLVPPPRDGLADQVRVLLPRISVLAIGPTTLRAAPEGEGNKEALPTALITLAADQVQAEKIIYAVKHSSLYFGLLTADSKIEPKTLVDARNLFS